MRELNISGVDLNLAPPLDALLRRRNVTLAAADVGLSQPAMSRALGRLRAQLGDPLLVRTARGYVLTPRAEALRPQVAGLLAQARLLFNPGRFDPGQEHRVVRLAAADPHTVLILPGVMARLAAEAPGIDLRVSGYSDDLLDRLQMGSLDMAFALSTTPLPPGVHSEPVCRDRLALVMRRGHPAAGQAWSLGDYQAWDHVGIALNGDGQSDIDAWLAQAGVSRRIAVVTPYFMAALAMVSATDMVTTVSEALARRFADTFSLEVKTPPFPNLDMETTLVCSHIRAADPLLVWVRSLIREAASRTFVPGIEVTKASTALKA